METGDTIVVVDAGGGTVDLISYTITGLKPILQVKEAASGSGALCGSTFLNMRFAKFLKSKLGKENNFDDEVLAEAMEVFEKKVFPLAIVEPTHAIIMVLASHTLQIGKTSIYSKCRAR